MANVLLNKMIASLKIESGAGPDQRGPGGKTPAPRQGAGQLAAMLKSLDKNGDGKITKDEAGGAPWFDRVDLNHDGVIDAAELEKLRQTMGAWGGRATPAPRIPKP
jgi:Ca2+-binding EF-hand superfamily protein